MKEQKILLLVDSDPDGFAETKSTILSFLPKSEINCSVSFGLANDYEAVGRCRNLLPDFILIQRDIVVQKKYSGLTGSLKRALPGIKIFVFGNDENIKRITSYIREHPEEGGKTWPSFLQSPAY